MKNIQLRALTPLPWFVWEPLRNIFLSSSVFWISCCRLLSDYNCIKG